MLSLPPHLSIRYVSSVAPRLLAADLPRCVLHHPANAQALPVGHRILWYEVEGILGQGGFGITYRARDCNLDQTVALKEYLPTMFAGRGADGVIVPTSAESKADFEWGLARFIDEGRTLARFDHPGIVRVASVFEANGTAYLVMRYEHGEPLDGILKRCGTLPEDRLKRILFDVMDGLTVVHEAGYIHRDIKPANIYVRGDESALLIDFGSARQALGVQTQTLTTLVSPGYAPFEQYYSDGALQGPWTDVYALGATAYRAMTGRAPIPAVDRSRTLMADNADVVYEHLQTVDGYSDGFINAVASAMAFREQDRPQSIREWRGAFEGGELLQAAFAHAPDVPTEVLAVDVDPAAAATVALDEIEATEVYAAEDDHAAAVTHAATEVLEPQAIPAPPKTGRRKLAIGGCVLATLILALWRPWQSDEGTRTAGIPANGGHGEPERVAAAAAPAENPVPVPAPDSAAPQTPAAARADSELRSPDAQIADPIPQLLDAAARDMADGHLTRPSGDNAVEKYRRVLALDPFNETATSGLDKIVEQYVSRARQAADGGDQYLANAYLDEAAIADPAHPSLLQARSDLARRPPPAVAETNPERTESVWEQAEQLTDKRSRKRIEATKKALRNQDYRKAMELIKKGFRG